MRFIHTGDWHLGRSLHGVSLIDDQAWWLERFIELVRAEKPDAVIVAGDVYDRAVPPAEAVALLDATLTTLVRDIGVPVIVVAGNHDSPERVGFGARVLATGGLHVAGAVEPHLASVVLGEGEDATRIWLLPYADPIETRAALGAAATEVHDHEAAVAAALESVKAFGADEPHQVLVSHHFVVGGVASDSERGLTVGGTGAVSTSVFDGFDYVALGHLHRRQTLADGRIHYPGSALAYAFDESGATKAVSVVTLGDGPPEIVAVELGARRHVRRIAGTYEGVLAGAPFDDARDDYIEVELDEPSMPPDALGRLREVYPNLLSLRRREDAYIAGEDEPWSTIRVEQRTDDDLYEEFFTYVTGEPLPDDQKTELQGLLTERLGAQR